MATGSDDATVRVWDIATMYNSGVDAIRQTFTFYEPQNRVTDLAVSGIGEMVVASSNQFVHVWNPLTGELLKTIQQPFGWYTALDISADGRTLATAYDGRRLEFWDTQTWARIKFLPLAGDVKVIAYSDNSQFFALGYADGRIQVWDARTINLLANLSRHADLASLAFSPQADQLVSSSTDGTVRIWDLSQLP